jgi:hypothetical protein
MEVGPELKPIKLFKGVLVCNFRKESLESPSARDQYFVCNGG